MLKYVIVITLALFLMLAAAGCGPLYGIFIEPVRPKPKVSAEHDMGDRKVLIWIERGDEHSFGGAGAILRYELTSQVRDELRRYKAVGELVDYEAVARYRHRHPNWAASSLGEIGEHFRADEVLYILIEHFQLRHEAGNNYYEAAIGGLCKVIDVDSGKRLWPENETHRRFAASGHVTSGSGQVFEARQVRELCRTAAQKITIHFYEHKKKQ